MCAALRARTRPSSFSAAVLKISADAWRRTAIATTTAHIAASDGIVLALGGWGACTPCPSEPNEGIESWCRRMALHSAADSEDSPKCLHPQLPEGERRRVSLRRLQSGT